MSDFSDNLSKYAQSAGEGMLGLGDQIRYGVSPAEKDEIMYRGDFPGAIKYSVDPAGAERATSGYLAGRQWGQAAPFLTDVFNRIRQTFVNERPELRKIAVDAATQGARYKQGLDFYGKNFQR